MRGPKPASVRDDAIKSECYPRILGLLDADEYQKLALSVIGVKRICSQKSIQTAARLSADS